jgi:hypothetical protein
MTRARNLRRSLPQTAGGRILIEASLILANVVVSYNQAVGDAGTVGGYGAAPPTHLCRLTLTRRDRWRPRTCETRPYFTWQPAQCSGPGPDLGSSTSGCSTLRGPEGHPGSVAARAQQIAEAEWAL